MPAKRPRADSLSDEIDLLFEKLFAMTDASDPANSVTRNNLQELKHRLLSAEAEKKEAIHKAAEEFTLRGAVKAFGLTYKPTLKGHLTHQWKIETSRTLSHRNALVSFSLIFLRAMTRGLISVAPGQLCWNLRSNE
jgi:hypothetical protein